MRLTSIIVLGIAVVMGIIAVFGVRMMLQNSQSSAAQARTSEVISSTVVVARQPLEFGTQLQPELLKEIPWAAEERPEGSFASISDVLGSERRVALRSIAPGELILQDRVSGFGGRATLSQIIEPGMRAMTLRVNDVSGTAGFVLPGDRVDVIVTVQDGKDVRDSITNILLQDVRVLAIDQMADDSQEGAIVAKATTLEVKPEDAQRIALASTIGELTLSLRNLVTGTDGDDAPEEQSFGTIRFEDLGPKTPARAAPARSSSRDARPAPKPAPSPYTTMKVIRGVETSRIEVLKDAEAKVISPEPQVSGAISSGATPLGAPPAN